MYAKAITAASLVAVVAAMPGSVPAYSSYAASSSVAPPAYSSEPVYSSSAAAYSSSAVVYSSSAVVSAFPSASASAYPSCWSECFAKEHISSEAELCGNTAVDACIQEDCCAEENEAYWAWYEGYCPAGSASVSALASQYAPVTSASAYAVASSSVAVIPTYSAPACWTACFAENDVTSEESLCGDDAVSQCIYETCDSSADQAYWSWYEGYCTGPATVTTVVTLTSPCAYTTSGAVETSYASTAWTPAGAPTSGAAPYPAGGAGASAGAGAGGAGGAWGSASAGAYGTASAYYASGTGAAWPAASSGWPVPATGAAAGLSAKSGFALLAGFLGLVALL